MHGFFGKIPSHGDFITRDLPRQFLDRWDEWLQNCIAESKAQLGESWLNIYLTSPIWRFAVKPGICGGAWTGILMPSVDRVGRYFPLTIATPIDGGAQPFQIAAYGNPWFESVEALALRTLDDDNFEANGLQSALGVVADIEIGPIATKALTTTADAWSLAVHGPAGADVPLAMADELIGQRMPKYSLWWTIGSEDVVPSALAVGGLPNPGSFAELLHGTWGELTVVPPGDSEPISDAGTS